MSRPDQTPAPAPVIAAAAVTVLLWASAFVGIRYAGRDFGPGPLALGRLLVGSLALGVVMLVRREPLPPRRALGQIAVCGVLWFGVYNVALNAAERRIDAGIAALLVNVGPIFIAVLAGLVLREGFPRLLLAGCAVAFAGAGLIGIATSRHTSGGGWGAILCIIAAATYAAGVIAQKPALRHASPLAVTWLACTVAAIGCLPFANGLVSELHHASARASEWMVYLGLFPTAIGFATWAYALSHTAAGRMGSTTYLVPPVALLLGWVMLGEVPPLLALPGGILCLAGVALARWTGPRRRAAPVPATLPTDFKRRLASLASMSSTAFRAAVVGAGPSGFYATDQLLKAGFAVDLYDELPTPFGLVRAGVAPDHPKIKSVTRVYAKTAQHSDFRFFGNVRLGRDVTPAELQERYHAVVYAIGTATDNRLGIPGEDRPGSHPATEFVAWYNGHPHFTDHRFDLHGGRAVVIGNGNVAIDVARMLVLDPEELAPTDTADHAIDAFGSATVDEVVLLGRRGPAQAAFTNPELRELGELRRADVIVDPAQLEGIDEPQDTTKQRNVAILREYAARAPQGRSHRLELRFLRSPLEILGDGEDGPVTGVRVGVNRLVTRPDGRVSAEPTGEEEVIECGLVLRSIGYRGVPIEGIPFDERRGLIRNEGGRVHDDDGVRAGEYVVGWIKRGPSGVIGTNKKDAADTVARIVEDAEAGRLTAADSHDAAAIAAWLDARAPEHVTWGGWEMIDARETELGEPMGRPRVKLVRLDELISASRPR